MGKVRDRPGPDARRASGVFSRECVGSKGLKVAPQSGRVSNFSAENAAHWTDEGPSGSTGYIAHSGFYPGWARPIRCGMRVKGAIAYAFRRTGSCRPRRRQYAADAGIGFTGVGRSWLSSISTALTNRLPGVYFILKGWLLVDARLRKRLSFPDSGVRMRQSALAS